MTPFKTMPAADLRESIRRTQQQQHRALEQAAAAKAQGQPDNHTIAAWRAQTYTTILNQLLNELDRRGLSFKPAAVQDWPEYTAPASTCTGVLS